MLAIFSCASAASGILGKNVWKSRYSCSACASEAVPPSAYQESPTASFARAIYSESGYVLISVCSVIRATSKRLRFMASMALSNSTLSGCTDATLPSGLTAFLLEQPTITASPNPTTTIKEVRRDINTSNLNECSPSTAHVETGRLWLCGDGRLARPPSAARLGLSRQHPTRTICHFQSATPGQPRRAPPGTGEGCPVPQKNIPQKI